MSLEAALSELAAVMRENNDLLRDAAKGREEILRRTTSGTAKSTASNDGGSTDAPATDKDGQPWDERIHATTKATNADGTWRKKKGVDADLVKQVEAELRGGGATDATGAVSRDDVKIALAAFMGVDSEEEREKRKAKVRAKIAEWDAKTLPDVPEAKLGELSAWIAGQVKAVSTKGAGGGGDHVALIRKHFGEFLGEKGADGYGERSDFVKAILSELGVSKATEITEDDREKAFGWLKDKAAGKSVSFDDAADEDEDDMLG